MHACVFYAILGGCPGVLFTVCLCEGLCVCVVSTVFQLFVCMAPGIPVLFCCGLMHGGVGVQSDCSTSDALTPDVAQCTRCTFPVLYTCNGLVSKEVETFFFI